MFPSYSEKICRVRTPIKNQTHRTQPFSCDMCDVGNWLSETDVEVHKKDSHLPAIRQQIHEHQDRFCMICMKLQKSRTDLVEHIKSRHLYSSPTAQRIEREIFICHYCSRIFFNKEILSIHIMSAHLYKNKKKATKYLTCPICKHIFKLRTIWFHFYHHEIPSVTCCDFCLTTFYNCEDLMKHVAKKHPRYYFCNMCDNRMTREAVFNAHLLMHSQMPTEGVKGFTNPDILMTTTFRHSGRAKWNRYKYNIHNALKGLDLPRFMYVCIICREICLSKQKAITHIIRDHLSPMSRPMRRAQHACACGQEFFNKVMLKHHVFKEKGMHRDLRENELPSPELFQNPTPNTTVSKVNLTNEQTDKQSQSNGVVILPDEVILPKQESHKDAEVISNDEIIIDSIKESITDVKDEVMSKVNLTNEQTDKQSQSNEVVILPDEVILPKQESHEDAEVISNDEIIIDSIKESITDVKDEVMSKVNLTNEQTDKQSQSNKVVILPDEVILPKQESHKDAEVISNDEIIIDSIKESITDVKDEVMSKVNLTNEQTDKQSQSNEVVILPDEVILLKQESHKDAEVISNNEIIIDSIEESITDVKDEVTLIRNDPKLPRNKRENIQNNDKTTVYQNDQKMMIGNYAEIHKNNRIKIECNDNVMDQNDEVIIMGDNVEIRSIKRKNIESNDETRDLNDKVTMMNDVEIQRKKRRAIDSTKNQDIIDLKDEIVDTNNKDIDENDDVIEVIDKVEVIDLDGLNDTDGKNN